VRVRVSVRERDKEIKRERERDVIPEKRKTFLKFYNSVFYH